MAAPNHEQQMAQAEEILGDRLKRTSFVKGLFFGEYLSESLPPYPDLAADVATAKLVDQLQTFCREQIDPVAIDRQARIPDEVIAGLGELGILGACMPTHAGGRGMSQTAYCQLLEVLGGHCGSTALFVNAHHSIGPRALVLFGNKTQQQKYLPKLAHGEWLSAFALTEPNAGSDAANVQTLATPTADGSGFILRGEKRWITNGGIANVLTVMARTPTADGKETRITAFIVTPDMPGFRVVEERMEKMGVRGTATSRLAFDDMFVPKENVLGSLGKGLRIALTVLDYGRTTFGACCTGAARFCVEHAVRHVQQRVQFDQPLANFELVREKIASMQAGLYAMEACTYQTAALIDSGAGDFMLETAMLKVFSTETLWKILNDTFQLYGGKAYFTDEPFERMVRDARINTIGEGANDVLRAFSALVGMRDVGLELEKVLHSIYSPLQGLGNISRFAGRKLSTFFVTPQVPVSRPELEAEGAHLGKLIGELGRAAERLLVQHQKEIVDRQYQLGRMSDAATEIFVSACVLHRLDADLKRAHHPHEAALSLATAKYYLRTARRRVRQTLASIWDNDDEATSDLAAKILR